MQARLDATHEAANRPWLKPVGDQPARERQESLYPGIVLSTSPEEGTEQHKMLGYCCRLEIPPCGGFDAERQCRSPLLQGRERAMNQSVDRALVMLEELGEGERRLGDLAQTLGTHKSTVLRILQTLDARGFVRRTDNGAYRLGVRVIELGADALAELDLRSAARAGLERIAAVAGETVHLAILDRGRVVYVDKVESVHPVRMYSRVGATAPVHCTGVGKVLLAFTPEDRWPELEFDRFTEHTILDMDSLRTAAERIRRRGWGVDEREHEDTIRCIAAPAFDVNGDAVAAISVSVPASRMSRKELDGYASELLEAAGMITRALGGDPGVATFADLA